MKERKFEGDVGGQKRVTCSTAGTQQVTVRDGRMVRVEPLTFDPAHVESRWSVDVNGKSYVPPMTVPLLPWAMTGKQMAYGEHRVLYPMKRVDWDPNGNRNTDRRGISGYERISWDEAYDIIHREMYRVISEYGSPSLSWFFSAHPEWESLHYFFSDWVRLWTMIGATQIDFTPNSWEGWACGAAMTWGFWSNQGVPGAPGTLMDISENDDLIILWGIEPIFHNMYGGLDEARIWKYWKELGKEVVVIEPLNNETSLVYADSWIPVLPGTDGALACGIAYVWITEGLYDREYLDTHTVGFDEEHLPEGVPAGQSFKSYIMGEGPDKVVKTPEWAEEHCGVPARIIRKLAREWGAKPTSFWVLCGGASRREYADTWSRLMVTLSAMQGFGKPGSNMVGSFISLSGPYDGVNQVGPIGYSEGGMNAVCKNFPMGVFGTNAQHLTFEKLYDFFEAGEGHYYGGDVMNMDADEYFEERDYPAEGCNEVHFLWQRGSTMTNPPDRNKHVRFIRHPKLEAFFVSAPWFDRDCRYADLVLPTCTCYERSDLTEPSSVGSYVPGALVGLRTAVYHQQCIEPVGESKTDLEICTEVANRLGLEPGYTEGNTEEDFLRGLFEKTNIPLSFEEMQERGYYVWPVPKEENWEPRQFSEFYEDPEANPVATPTGKLEIFSTTVWDRYGYNEEIPPVPHYIPEKEGFDSAELKKKYPLQQLMAHPKFRFHGKYNDWSPIAAMQGPGQWWIRVDQWEEGSGRHMKMQRRQLLCQHCDECALAKAAPEAVYTREDGIVIIDPEAAHGKRELVDLCPYHTVYWNEELQVAQKCTLCAHLLDAGWEKPRCMNACPADALSFVDADEISDETLWGPPTWLHPEYGTSPSLVYVNQPAPFIAGEVASADLADVVECAHIVAKHQVAGETYEGFSNSLGDFHIRIEKPGFYAVSFMADGYKRRVMTDVFVDKGLSLDVVKLDRRVDVRKTTLDVAAVEEMVRRVAAESLNGADWAALVPQTSFEVKGGLFGSVKVAGAGAGPSALAHAGIQEQSAAGIAGAADTPAGSDRKAEPAAEPHEAPAAEPQGYSGSYDFVANTPLGKKKGKFVLKDNLDGTFSGTSTLMGHTSPLENGVIDDRGEFGCDTVITSPIGKMPGHVAGAIVDGRVTGKTITKVGEFEFLD